MTSKDRVMTALNYKQPDRIPKFDSFWAEFRDNCIHELNLPEKTDLNDYFNIDIAIVAADETPFPTRVETITSNSGEKIYRDSWGRVVRTKNGCYFYEELDFLIKEKRDLERINFDSPYLDFRYRGFEAEKFRQSKRCLFCKTGGPFLRSAFIRGKENFLLDIAADPSFAKALADRVADHIIEIGKESLRRGDLYDTGLWVYDDMAYNHQPLMSPDSFSEIFLPAYKRMVKAFKDAGAVKVVLHSDGNIEPLLDMLLEAGIEAINPVEPKAGMHIPTLRARYGNKLSYIGGMCNAQVLPRGSCEEIEAQALEIIEAAKDGGVIIGAHSIGPDISVRNYMHYHKVVMKSGFFDKNEAE